MKKQISSWQTAKQKKIVNKIKFKSGQTTPSNTPNDDECYTPLNDIINEIKNYPPKLFKDKNGLSPFDWDLFEKKPDIYGITIFFNSDGSIKKTVALTADKNKVIKSNKKISIKYKEKDKTFLIDGKNVNLPRCNFIRAILSFAPTWKIKSWTFSGYNPFLEKGIDYKLHNYKKYDWVITNPAFSLIKNFLDILIDTKINFIILSDFLSRTNPRVGQHLMLQECYLGFNIHCNISFANYDITKMLKKEKDKKVSVDWITNLDIANNERAKIKYKTGIKFQDYKNDYKFHPTLKMKDGGNVLLLSSRAGLPDDYYGWFFGPISLLDKITQHDFEWYGSDFQSWHNENIDKSPFNFKSFKDNKYRENYVVYYDGKRHFSGIIAKRRKENDKNS